MEPTDRNLLTGLFESRETEQHCKETISVKTQDRSESFSVVSTSAKVLELQEIPRTDSQTELVVESEAFENNMNSSEGLCISAPFESTDLTGHSQAKEPRPSEQRIVFDHSTDKEMRCESDLLSSKIEDVPTFKSFFNGEVESTQNSKKQKLNLSHLSDTNFIPTECSMLSPEQKDVFRKDFNDESKKSVDEGQSFDETREVQEAFGDPSVSLSSSPLATNPNLCSSEMVDSDEPIAKKPRTLDHVLNRRSSNDSESTSLVPSINLLNQPTSSIFSKVTESSDNRKAPIDSLYFDGMQFFGSKHESKVTISPVRNKDLGSAIQGSTGSLGSSNSNPSGSVTITKLSTGSTLNVESKDLKTILGSSGQVKSPKIDPCVSRIPNTGNGFRLGTKLDLMSVEPRLQNNKPSRIRSSSGSDTPNRCNKCFEIYVARDDHRHHVCKSSLEQNTLPDVVDRLKRNISPSRESTDNSRSSSRAESPVLSLSPSLKSFPPMANPHPGAPSSDLGIKKTKQVTETGMPLNSVKCKFIKDSKDELHIEGRPKLSIVKVPRLECGSNASNVSTKSPQSILSSSQTQVVPKLKLSTLPSESKKSASLKDSPSMEDSANRIKSNKRPTEASKKLNFDEAHCDIETVSNDKSNRKVELLAGAAKIRIKYSGAPSDIPDTSKAEAADRLLPEDSFPFAFSGRPTYSPSRVEPNVPTKESPRDASNKDSPASQADSGVFSIASSSSPSKADCGTNADGTSPESPNRDRMTSFHDQTISSREWKSVEPPPKSLAQPSESPFSGVTSNQNLNMMNTRPGSYDQSFRQGQCGTGPTSGNMVFNQQQQQQRTHQHSQMSFMSRLSSENDFGVYNGFGMNKLTGGSSLTGQSPASSMNLQHQQRQQFSYQQRMFGFGTSEPEPKKKRGRPRKNEAKEPGTKRAYKRRPKIVDSTPLCPNNDVNNSIPLVSMTQPLNRGSLSGVTSNRPHQQMGSVYNFEDEETNEDLGSILPRRLTGTTQSSKQKYSFGSSSDEEIPRPPQGAVHQQNLLPGSRPTQGNGPFQNYHFPHSSVGSVNPGQLVTGLHQKNTMGIGTIGGIGAVRSVNSQQSLSSRSIVNQHQQMVNQQAKQAENLPMSEEDCRYSSEILEKDKGIGIKIKIKKAPESSNSSVPTFLGTHQQDVHQNQNSVQELQKQQNESKEASGISLSDRLQGNERIAHQPSSTSQPSMTTLAHGQQMTPSNPGHLFPGKNVGAHLQSQQNQLQHGNLSSSPSTLNLNSTGYASPHSSNSFTHSSTHVQSQASFGSQVGIQTNGLHQQPMLHHHPQQLNHQQSQHQGVQQPNSLSGIRSGHPGVTPPLRSPYNSIPSPSHQPHFGQQIHQPSSLSHSYRFANQSQGNNQSMVPQSQMHSHQQSQKALMHQQGQTMNNFYYNQGIGNSFNMQSQQNQFHQGSFPTGAMNMGGGAYGGNNPYRYGSPLNGGVYAGYNSQYGMMSSNGQNTNSQFQDQQFNNQFNCHQQFGNNMMFGSSNGISQSNLSFGNRMIVNNDVMNQPIPPTYRHQQQMVHQQSMMTQSGQGNLMGNSMISNLPNMSGNIGQPRISPSSMHKPMPGVGLVSPSLQNRQQPTPLVSPQSLHSMSEHSPASSMHNQPLTPNNNYCGPSTPQSCNPLTPIGMSMTSPMTPGQNLIHSSVNQNPHGFQQSLMSPLSSDDPNSMRSPSVCVSSSSLRKIRRPSKAYKDGGPATPKIDNEESLSSEKLGDHKELFKEVGEEKFPSSVQGNKEANCKVNDNMFVNSTLISKSSPSPQSAKLQKVLGEDSFSPTDKNEKIVEDEKVTFHEARWDELDENLWRRVFQFCIVNDGSVPFLVRASRVCSKWHRVSQDASLWTHLDLSQGRLKEKYRNDKKLEWFLRKYPSAKEIKIGGWKNTASTSTLKLVAQFCPNLISFGLSGCSKLTNEDMKVIADSFPKLERIDLSGVSPSSCSSRSAVSSTCLSDFIATLGSRLTHFSIANNKMSGLPFVFKALATHSSSLEVLDISNITTTSRDTILINIEKFQKGCQKLRVLNANHTMLSLSETPIKEQVQSPGFPSLRELHVAVDSRGYFDGMEDQHIERILKKSANLRLLDIRGCQNVTESCLIRLPTWDLERLAVAGCSAAANSYDGLELVVKKWANKLVDIDISLTTGRAVNNAIDAFAESDGVVLRKLNLYGSSVNLKSLTRLLKNCFTLECVNLSSCKGLPRGMKRMYGTPETVHQLTQDITDGKFLTDGNESDD